MGVVLVIVGGCDDAPVRRTAAVELPHARRVTRTALSHPAIPVTITREGEVWADPQVVFVGDGEMLRASGLHEGPQRFTLDTLGVLLSDARDHYRLRGGDSALEGPDNVCARSLVLSVAAEGWWQHIAWVALVANESLVRKVEFEVSDGAGATARLQAHMPSDWTGRNRDVRIEMDGADPPLYRVGDVRMGGLEALGVHLKGIGDKDTTAAVVAIAGRARAQAGIKLLELVHAAGFRGVWWAIDDIPPTGVRKETKLPEPR
jgi:hypothetical protein